MKRFHEPAGKPAFVAIDISKSRHEVLIELPDGSRKSTSVANSLSDFETFGIYLRSLGHKAEIALEPTGDYHRAFANFLLRQGHHVRFVSSIATHRTREALYNSWDKNDPKDAQVILHLLKGGVTQIFADPLENGYNDLEWSSSQLHAAGKCASERFWRCCRANSAGVA